MTSTRGALGLIGASAGGIEKLRTGLVEPAIERGWQVGVTLTPTAATWLEDLGEIALLEKDTGLPVRGSPRLPREPSPHPAPDCYVVAPATANTVAKMALGIADNQALTQVNEAIGTRGLPVVAFPRINAAHARQPAWAGHLEALRAAGVWLVEGDEVWPLYEPRQAPPGRELPWAEILDTAATAVETSAQPPA